MPCHVRYLWLRSHAWDSEATETMRTTRPRRTIHSAVSSGRRVHNTDASIILEILPGIKKDQETRASSHAYVYLCTQARTAEYRLPPHHISRKVTLYQRNIEPWRDLSLLRSGQSSSKTMDLSTSWAIKIFFTRAITLNVNIYDAV